MAKYIAETSRSYPNQSKVILNLEKLRNLSTVLVLWRGCLEVLPIGYLRAGKKEKERVSFICGASGPI